MIPEDSENDRLTFFGHLDVLRKHLVRIVIYLCFGAVLAFMVKSFLFDQLLFAPSKPMFPSNVLLCRLSQSLNIPTLCINQHPPVLVNLQMAGQFRMHIFVSLIAGFILAFPLIMREIFVFTAPAFSSSVKRKTLKWIIWICLLFLLGVLCGYYLITPFAIDFLVNYSVSDTVTNTISLDSYVITISSLTLACGLVFELPVLIYFLAVNGIITPALMRNYRRHAIILIFLVAAIITPPDVVSQVLTGLPLYAMYEISIYIASIARRKNSPAAG